MIETRSITARARFVQHLLGQIEHYDIAHAGPHVRAGRSASFL